jgi:hypothetical protein
MQSCKTCVHAKRAAIEDAILRKVPHARIGEEFGLSHHSIYRHSKHLSRSVIVNGTQPVLNRVEALMDRLEKIAQRAESGKDWRAAVAAMREVRGSLELVAKLTGQIAPAGSGVTVGVAVNVNTGHSAADLSDRDLDTHIALEVAAATNGFDPRVIERMKRLAHGRGELGALPDGRPQLVESIDI